MEQLDKEVPEGAGAVMSLLSKRNLPDSYLRHFLGYSKEAINYVRTNLNIPEEKENKDSKENEERIKVKETVLKEITCWEDLKEIDKFVIFDGSEKIYDIHILGKKIRLEGKEILDHNIFRLRFFESFGLLLPSSKGIVNFWAELVSNWFKNYKIISIEKTEDISEAEEAKSVIIDYINNCTPADNYVIREGIITIKESFIYVPTKIIKKILKRENLTISLRKLAYLLDEYIASGSIPIKIENKSERFWRFQINKFQVKTENKIQVKEETDDSDE